MKLNLARIPHIYHDTKYVRKLFEILKQKHINVTNMWQELNYFNDLEKSKGHMLDVLGGNFKIARLGRTDEEYRKILKFEIPTFNFFGSPYEIRRILSEYYDISIENFVLKELSGKIVIKIPDTISKSEVLKNIKRLKAAGVGLQVDIEIYIEDYTLFELEKMTLTEIEKITLARE
ncbi:hypothetical protein FSEG_01080 [Fusobacterium necrophorum D12]|uniref:hypothetical protein n=1 Tax=Fusobacterium necrophorum TaxID=859 RepID=UPI0001BC480E|nr:hypothetical protein [Fusobacterium necrophorum]EFS23473.1 hypothetical protein FSEG_01080 [Fusobacterium necrophorum D12]KYM51375.1 hypothetical protein A2U04_11745 [Fusobacterium necrophorum subsp. funduliforme]